MTYTSEKRLCLDADGKVVDCDSLEARELLIGAGGQLTDAQAEKYGLTKDDTDAKARAEIANKARPSSANK